MPFFCLEVARTKMMRLAIRRPQAILFCAFSWSRRGGLSAPRLFEDPDIALLIADIEHDLAAG